MPTLTRCVFVSLILSVFLLLAVDASAQCPAFTFSAAAGPGYRTITLTIGGQINGTASVQKQESNGSWTTLFPVSSTGDRILGPTTGYSWAHNHTVNFRAQNGGSCTGWINASATTFDVGYPWLYIHTGFVGGVMVESGPVPPDLNTAVLYSNTGVEPFTFLGSWQTQRQEFVPLGANQTHYFYAKIYLGLEERRSPIKMVRRSADQDYGIISCNASVGRPVNVTNGNMFLSQTDFELPGVGRAINLTRSYNSLLQVPGIFGLGWTTEYDQYLTQIDAKNIRLQMPDGRGVYFARASSNDSFTGITPGFPGVIVANGDSTYTLTFKDGTSNKYGSSGKLLWLKDRNGNQTTINYDTSGILTGVTDASGRTLTIEIGPDGYVSEISDSLGAVATYEYYNTTPKRLQRVNYADGSKYQFDPYDTTSVSGKAFLTTVKDASNNVLETHLYDDQGRATTSETANGQEKFTLDYSNAAFTTVADGLTPARVTKFYFDRSDVRTVVKKTEGICGCGGSGNETTQYFYDAELNLVKIVDALSNEKHYTYDSERNVTQIEEKSGTTSLGIQKWTYNSFGQVLTYKDRVDSSGSNNTAVYTFDANGNLLTATNALGKTTTLVYPSANNKGLPDSVQDARNNITKFKWFSGSGLLQEVEDPYAKKTNFTYDARGRTDTVTNTYGHVTDYNYFDDTQRKVEMIYPNSDKITYKYDVRRLLESVTDERGKITNYEFDPAYRLKKITDPLGHVKEFHYDLMSNLDWSKDPLGNQTDFKYDDFNRLKEIEYPAATSGGTRLKEKFVYDKTGRITKFTDTANRDTVYAYDDVTRTNTVTNAESEVTTTKYNLRFQTTEVKDALNQVYTFSYDAMGQLLSQTRAGGTMSFVFDDVGNQTKRTDYAGRVTNYEYDNLNRLTKIEYDNGSGNPTPKQQATYGYDYISRLTSATNENGTVSFGYDNRNRTISTTDVFGQALVYEYERTPTVNQKRLKLNGSLYATYNYDNAERLENIVNASDSTTISFGYDNENKLTSRVYPNGVTTTYEYFNNDKLKRLKDATSSATLFDRQYHYNSANQISGITGPEYMPNFEYDDVNRLTSVVYSAQLSSSAAFTSENYGYDAVGNRTSSHLSSTYGYQANQFNRLASTTSATYGFDANGNTTTKSEGSNFWRYGFDHENRLVSASTRKQSVRYRYDALGRRIERNLNTGRERTKFTYDGDDVIIDDNKGTLTKYINGEGIDNKLRQTTGSTGSYFLADHLGSTNGLTDASGSITASNTYDSFGNQTKAAFPSRYQFTGREFDSFTGLQYSRARFYDPKLGRFISEDPIGFAGGDVNLFGYVKNDPLSNIDPMGLNVEATFSQSRQKMRVIDRWGGWGIYDWLFGPKSDQEYSVFSGTCRCSEATVNDGPIPRGLYLIDKDHDRNGNMPWKRISYRLYASQTNTMAGPFHPYRKWVDSESGREVTRDNFYIHPGSLSYGCITFQGTSMTPENAPWSEIYSIFDQTIQNTSPIKVKGDRFAGILNVID